MIIYKKDVPEIFNSDFFDKTYDDEHQNNEKFADSKYVQSIHTFSKDDLNKIGIHDDKYIGCWQTESYEKCDIDSDIQLVTYLTKVKKISKTVNIDAWQEVKQ